MFYNNKIIFFSILFIFSAILLYLINQQIVLVGILSNLFISLIMLYLTIIIIAGILSNIFSQIYILFSKLIKYKYNKAILFWWAFTIFAYSVSFVIFMFAIEY